MRAGSKCLRSLTVVLVVGFLLPGCTRSDGHAPAAWPLEEFTVGDIEYEFGIRPNNEGPSAPCVAVAGDYEREWQETSLCPTERHQEDEYAAAFPMKDEVFLIGFGLRQGETLQIPQAIEVIATEPVDGRRFFLAHLPAFPVGDIFEISVEGPDGSRSIQASVSRRHDP